MDLFLDRKLSFGDCIAALDAALASLIPDLEGDQIPRLRIVMQSVLARLADIGVLSREEYIAATAKLVGFEYAGTYLDTAVFIECARQAQYDPEGSPLLQ